MVNFISYCSRLFAACVLLALSFQSHADTIDYYTVTSVAYSSNTVLGGSCSSIVGVSFVDLDELITSCEFSDDLTVSRTSFGGTVSTVYLSKSGSSTTYRVTIYANLTAGALCYSEASCQEYAADDCGDSSVSDWSYTDPSTFSYTCSDSDSDDSGDSDEECTIDNNYCDEADDDGSVDAGDSSDDSTDTGDDSGSCSTESGCYALAQSACSPSAVASYTWTSGSEYSFTCAADDSDDSTDTGDDADDSTDTGDDTDSGDSSDSGDDSDSSSGSSGSASGSYSSDGSDNGTSATSLTANGCTSFTCSDSAAACYIAKIQWVKSCENEGLYDEGGAATKLANTLSDYNNNTDSSALFTSIDVNDYTGKYTDGSGFTASSDAACPANQTLDTPLGTFEIDFGFICDGLAILKWFVICLATYQSVVVIARAF